MPRRIARRRSVRSPDKVDLLLVVGAKNSSNSNRLREIGDGLNVKSHLIDGSHQVEPAWFVDVDNVGITAGASAPETLVQELVAWLDERFEMMLETLDGIQENIHFRLPPELIDDTDGQPSHLAARPKRGRTPGVHGNTPTPTNQRRRLRHEAAPHGQDALSARPDAGTLVPLQSRLCRLRQDRLSQRHPEQASERPRMPGCGRGMRRTDRLHTGRRTPHPQGHRRDRRRHRRTKTLRLSLHQRGAGEEEDR